MSKNQVAAGSIVLIPISKGYVPAKILYRSQYFKDVILLGIYRQLQSQVEMPPELPDEFAALIYASQTLVLKKRWPCVGTQSIRPSEHGLSKRIVGDDVWLEDVCLGTASESQFSTLPRMSVCGFAALEAKVEKLMA